MRMKAVRIDPGDDIVAVRRRAIAIPKQGATA